MTKDPNSMLELDRALDRYESGDVVAIGLVCVSSTGDVDVILPGADSLSRVQRRSLLIGAKLLADQVQGEKAKTEIKNRTTPGK